MQPVESPSLENISTQLRFSGRFVSGSGGAGLQLHSSWAAFNAAKQKADAEGYRLTSIDIMRQGDVTWYVGVWVESDAPPAFIGTTDWAVIEQHFNTNAEQGISLSDINVFQDENGAIWYTGVWLGGSKEQTIFHNLTAEQFDSVRENQKTEGRALIKAQCNAFNTTELRFTCLFEQASTSSNGIWNSNGLRTFVDYMADPNHSPGNVNSLQITDYGVDGAQRVLAVFQPSAKQSTFVLDETWQEFVATYLDKTGSGLRLTSISMHERPASWEKAITGVLQIRAVGFSYSISKDSRVIECGGSGKLRKSEPSVPAVPMTVQSALTLGSVSKTLDALAMILAIQDRNENTLTLQTPFFSVINGFRGITDADIIDDRVRTITILDLLTHTGGLNDPGGYLPQTTDQGLWRYIKAFINQEMNPGKLVNNKAGTVFSYSNGGFQTLRGVVQAIFQSPTYEQWVKQYILDPSGMKNTYLPVPDHDYPVRYYTRDLNLTNGTGVISDEASWNSSAEDMAIFMGLLRNHTLLDAEYLRAMFTPRQVSFVFEDGKQKSQFFQIYPGFDGSAIPAPQWIGKNGSYTNYSQAQIMRIDSTGTDVTLQINTDTAYNPVSPHYDNLSIWPFNVIWNAYMKVDL